MSLICIPVQARSFNMLRGKIARAEKYADVLEIWIDHLEEFIEPEQILGLSKKPLLIVNKSKAEGGHWRGTEEERIAQLKKYLKKAAYIDISLSSKVGPLVDFLKAARGKTKIIISHHDFKKTRSLAMLLSIAQRCFWMGADVAKIVPTAQKMEDNLIPIILLQRAQKEQKKLIAFCMGDQGKISRWIALQHNSYMMYFALDERSKTAPGQITIKEFLTFKRNKL